jgi:hypothetical protein
MEVDVVNATLGKESEKPAGMLQPSEDIDKNDTSSSATHGSQGCVKECDGVTHTPMPTHQEASEDASVCARVVVQHDAVAAAGKLDCARPSLGDNVVNTIDDRSEKVVQTCHSSVGLDVFERFAFASHGSKVCGEECAEKIPELIRKGELANTIISGAGFMEPDSAIQAPPDSVKEDALHNAVATNASGISASGIASQMICQSVLEMDAFDKLAFGSQVPQYYKEEPKSTEKQRVRKRKRVSSESGYSKSEAAQACKEAGAVKVASVSSPDLAPPLDKSSFETFAFKVGSCVEPCMDEDAASSLGREPTYASVYRAKIKRKFIKRGRIAAKRTSGSKQFAFLDSDHPAFKEAHASGLGNALCNLASRAEIMSRGFPIERLLAALRESDGLVNKAKIALLSI